MLAAMLPWCLLLTSSAVFSAEIHDAASKGDVAVIDRLIAAHAPTVNAQDATGLTPLHYAAYMGRLAAAQDLLEHGAQANARDAAGHTPLFVAAFMIDTARAGPLYRAAGLRPDSITRRKEVSQLRLMCSPRQP